MACRYTAENSIYVSPDFARRGIGLILPETFIDRCTGLGYRQMIAVIGDSQNQGATRVHEKTGFKQVGVLPSISCKLDQWVDSVLMQRALGWMPPPFQNDLS